jgi:RNA polymerase sigma-70 factor (ECF subfamily)
MTEGLLAGARQGDAEALEELLASVAPAIQRFGRRMCKNAHDADDVLQDTLLAVATYLHEFEGRSSLLSWVFTLTRTACARRRRGMKNQPTVELPDTRSADADPEQAAASRELAAALDHAIDALPDDQREVIALRDIEGLSAAEAAATLDISVEALKSRLHRAREALRAALRPMARPAAASCPDVVALWSRKLEGDLSSHDCRRSASSAVSPAVKARVAEAVRLLRSRA